MIQDGKRDQSEKCLIPVYVKQPFVNSTIEKYSIAFICQTLECNPNRRKMEVYYTTPQLTV